MKGADNLENFESEKAHQLIKKMKHINRIHHCTIERKVSEMGLHRSQHMVLMYLVKHAQGVSQIEIAQNFDISPAAVAVTLKKLESCGYIERNTVQEDNRKNSVVFTQKGKDIVEKSKELFDSVDSKMLETITDEEYDILTKCFDKMLEALKQYNN